MRSNRAITGTLALAIALGHSAIALAADDHDHGSKYGGQFVLVEGHQGVEMVVSSKNITFHITEKDKPADLSGASFKAVVQTEAGVKMYPLTAEGGLLKAELATELPAGSKVALTGKDGHGHTLQARFVTK